mmetsp:Transcript_16549/g.26419  ORF Transcript_16549/g.26419 Transcript_16549/m.26419 type:complete len:87 (+) Transcript_16549:1443-1703(+)
MLRYQCKDSSRSEKISAKLEAYEEAYKNYRKKLATLSWSDQKNAYSDKLQKLLSKLEQEKSSKTIIFVKERVLVYPLVHIINEFFR